MGNDNFYQHYKDQEQQQREQYKESVMVMKMNKTAIKSLRNFEKKLHKMCFISLQKQ